MIGQSKTQSGTQKKRLSKNGLSSELPPLFVAADQNKDGYVSKDDAPERWGTMLNFDAADQSSVNGPMNIYRTLLIL
jgi:hypothetical protein